MSYTVRVYGPILNQSLSQYWLVLQMCDTFCEHQITQATVNGYGNYMNGLEK